jgi:hypothetical protein
MSDIAPPEQTVCIKSVHQSMLQRVEDAISKQETKAKLGVHRVIDQDRACAGKFLVYANYASGRDAVRARDSLEAWVADKWPVHHGERPLVMLNSDLSNHVYFAVYVANTPPGTTPAELAPVFAKYGPLRKSCAIKKIKEQEFFINFMTYAGADAALQAARCGALLFEGSVLQANAARNTKYINTLIAKMREPKNSFSIDDAKRVGEEMKDWPPLPNDIEALLKANPQHFDFDRKRKLFHVIDRSATISPAATPPPPALRPRAATSEERAYKKATSEELASKDALIALEQSMELWLSKQCLEVGDMPVSGGTFANALETSPNPPSTPPNSPPWGRQTEGGMLSDDSGSNRSSNSTKVSSEGVEQWDVDQVLSFFERCRFPTSGVVEGQVDGMTLLSLYQDKDAEAIFTTPTPEGMGFNRLLFRGRFRVEMTNLRCDH